MPKKAKKKAADAAAGRAARSAPGPFYRPFAGLERTANETGSARSAAREARAPLPTPTRPAAPPPSARPGGGASDADTFAIYMAGVDALEPRANRIPRSASEVEQRPRPVTTADLDAPARAAMGSLVSEGLRFEVSDDGERIEGRRVDLDPRELRRLRRGEFPIDGRLDLHGMTAVEARGALEAFLAKRRAEGDRVVVVVHGKGRHSARGDAVLRGEIGAWLSQGRAARDVSAFASAGPIRAEPALADDAERPGALFVLLAR